MKKYRIVFFVSYLHAMLISFMSYCIANPAFLLHLGTRELLRQMPTYIEKKHYHVGKKFADVDFVWHPDTLFQPNDISVGTSLSVSVSVSLSCRK